VKDQGPVDATRPAGVGSEPWVALANGAALATWSREDEIVYNQVNRQSAKLAFYVAAYDFITENRVEGDYHEYGCHRARTFRMSLTEARRHGLERMKFFAFDSFEGLPTPETAPAVTGWQRGALSTSEVRFQELVAEHGIYVDRCVTVKGFYGESLTEERQRAFVTGEQPIALACIDCDLYESAVPVFRFIEPLLQEGSLLYVDDYFTGYKGSPVKGVARAFTEFQATSRFAFAPHMQIGWWGRSFIAYRNE
jgi:hypothetical protein